MSAQYQIEDHAPIETAATVNPSLLHAVIEAQARRVPHHAAIEVDGRQVSFAELNGRANQVANFFIGRGVEAGDVVAFQMPRGVDLFVGLLGAMKAGATSLPIDLAQSADRNAALIEAWNPALIVTTRSHAAATGSSRHVVIEDEQGALDSLMRQDRIFGGDSIEAATPAHIVFKAGGAGTGIAVSHGDTVKFLASMVSVYGIEAHHRGVIDASSSLDVFIEEAWALLSVGATVIVADAEKIAEDGFLADERVSFLSAVPGTLAAIDGETPALEVVVAGGTKCSIDLAVSWSMRVRRLVSLKAAGDRIASFAIEQDADAWRPRMLYIRSAERAAA